MRREDVAQAPARTTWIALLVAFNAALLVGHTRFAAPLHLDWLGGSERPVLITWALFSAVLAGLSLPPARRLATARDLGLLAVLDLVAPSLGDVTDNPLFCLLWLGLNAALLLRCTERWGGASLAAPSPRPLLGSHHGRALLLLAALLGLQAYLSLSAATRLAHVGARDTAYYYVAARSLASGRTTDDIRWHHLGPVELDRPLGDYWSLGWPLLLSAPLRAVGTSMRACLVVCALLSVALPLLVFGAARAWGRSMLVASLAALLVVAQVRLRQTNVTPDVILSYQLACLLGLGGCLWLRRSARPLALIALGGLLAVPYWLRGDGFVALGAVALAVLLDPGQAWRARAGRIAWLLLGFLALCLPLWAYNLHAFGALSPGPRSSVLVMTRYDDLYAFLDEPSLTTWREAGLSAALGRVWRSLWECLAALPTQLPWPLVVLALAGAVERRDGALRLRRGAVPLLAFVILSWVIPCSLAAAIANEDRFVLNVAPVLCLLAAASLLHLPPRWRLPGAVGVLLLASSAYLPQTLRGPMDRSWEERFREVPPDLRPGNHPRLTREELVLTRHDCQVAAILGARTVGAPRDGREAQRAAIEAYRPRYLHERNGREPPPLPAHRWRRVAQSEGGTWYELTYSEDEGAR